MTYRRFLTGTAIFLLAGGLLLYYFGIASARTNRLTFDKNKLQLDIAMTASFNREAPAMGKNVESVFCHPDVIDSMRTGFYACTMQFADGVRKAVGFRAMSHPLIVPAVDANYAFYLERSADTFQVRSDLDPRQISQREAIELARTLIPQVEAFHRQQQKDTRATLAKNAPAEQRNLETWRH